MSDPIAWRRARAALAAGITAGTYPVGDLLPPTGQLREEFGVGERPLRDAIATLRKVGVLRYVHGRGVIVDRLPTPEDELVDAGRDLQAVVADHERRLRDLETRDHPT